MCDDYFATFRVNLIISSMFFFNSVFLFLPSICLCLIQLNNNGLNLYIGVL